MNPVYYKEHEILKTAENIADIGEENFVSTKDYFALVNQYKSLLRKTEKLTKFSDQLQNKLKEEEETSNQLLLNTLPKKVVSDLKLYGKTWPERFNNVSVFFSDFVGFTKQSSKLEPQFLIEELNDIFSEFDNIISDCGCERLKTIGDAYMAVCGMPVPDEKHAEKMIQGACNILSYIEQRNANHKWQWKLRIGIHSGAVVGGVVGIKKYIYDVFGDTINMASRMESNSEPMKINVSEQCYQLAKSSFKFERRSPASIKGKGLQQMYFVIP
ncbi:MAG: hypothetical protein C0594_16075 [Marinilabiliales bacterium]|mgnify:CR=1 FL=1|nr:MAG: hypothetical protein C0594_16075 [Marinilabiliales bacterium]